MRYNTEWATFLTSKSTKTVLYMGVQSSLQRLYNILIASKQKILTLQRLKCMDRTITINLQQVLESLLQATNLTISQTSLS